MHFVLLSPSSRPAVTIARLLNTFRTVVLDTTPAHADAIVASIRRNGVLGVAPVTVDTIGGEKRVVPGTSVPGRAVTLHLVDARALADPERDIWPLRRFASGFDQGARLLGYHDRVLVLVDGLTAEVPHGIDGDHVAVVQVEGLGPDEFA